MCGIAGFASPNPFWNRARLERMRDTLFHRGPDDAGCALWNLDGRPCAGEPGQVGLAHRRLSIIDLSAAGRQPMTNETGSLSIIFNGEFYNFQEYRTALSARHRFASNTDTETIIHLFEESGIEKTLQCMNGMFAFALWEASSATLHLARDRLGKKPLYYVHLADGALVFASEIKALLHGGFVDQEKIDPAALIQFWTYGYATGTRTIFQQIKRLLPGHYAIWHEGVLTIREYWDCPFGLEMETGRSLDDLADELEETLCDAIRQRLTSDVPLGLFLSGGIDSSLVAALTVKVAGRDIQSYTIGFSQAAFDESAQAAAVAGHLGLPNTILTVQEDLEPFFASIARQFDEPFGDSSAIPTYFVSKLAREHVTVVLTGDGGDELFAGYDLYAKALFLWGDKDQRALFRQHRTLMETFSDLWFRHGLKRQRLTVLEMLVSPKKLRRILLPDVWKSLNGVHPYGERERWYARIEDADILSQFQYVNLKTYLSDSVLAKVDRMSMAHGQECRSPLLDHRVVEIAAKLPYQAKIDALGNRKVLLRRILEKYLPRDLVNRPKRGFSPPWAQWCRGALGDRLRRQWQSQNNRYQNPGALRVIFQENAAASDALQWAAFSSLQFFTCR